jgi:hypothetical protein
MIRKLFGLVLGSALVCHASVADAAVVNIPASTISSLKVFTSNNALGEELVVYLTSGTACGTKSGYYLELAGGKNSTASAILHAAFLNGRGVSLELDNAIQSNGRCAIVMVSAD